MSALGWLLLVLTALALAASLAFNCWQSRQLDQVHGTHAGSRPRGELPPARPGTTTPAEAAAHADAMWRAGEPYLPQPDGRHVQAWPPLTERTVPVAQTETRAPWETETASQPVLTQEMQDMRAEYTASYLREHGATPETMREAMERLHAHPVPGYGETCVANVLAAGQERGAA